MIDYYLLIGIIYGYAVGLLHWLFYNTIYKPLCQIEELKYNAKRAKDIEDIVTYTLENINKQ